MVVLLDLDEDDAIIDPTRTGTYTFENSDTSDAVIESIDVDDEDGILPIRACANLNSFSAALGCYP